MTGYELNKAIAGALGFEVRVTQSIDYKGDPYARHEVLTGGFWRLTPDYCNNWNVLMPLVVEYEITLYKLMESDGWHAFVNSSKAIINLNPQRALAECLLKALIKDRVNQEAYELDRDTAFQTGDYDLSDRGADGF
jgi:hypothetical protein